MGRKLVCLAAVAAALVPQARASSLFSPTKDGSCKAQSANGCGAKAAAVDRLEKGNHRTTVGDVSTGTLNCAELYDHETTWTVALSETETIVAEKTIFLKGYGDFVTWCGSIVGEVGGELCISWKVGHKCSASNFHMLATRGDSETGISRSFETQPGTPVRRRLQDGTEVVTDDDVAVIEVFQEYLDEDENEAARRRLSEESLQAPDLEYLPDGRKASAVEYSIQQVQNWKDGRTQADMFLRHGRHLRSNASKAKHDEHRELATLDNGSNIDIMVVFTAKAAALAGGEAALRSALATHYAKFATMMTNSNMAMSFTVAGVYQTSYVESASLTTDLTTLRSGQYLTTGESIASVRTKIGADLVQMIASQPASCGYGYVFGPTSTSSWGVSNGFSAVHYGCMGQYSHMHEIGHNVGLQHDAANGVSAFGYGYGYKYCVTGGFRTLMSYSCSSGTSVARKPVISSPDVTYMTRASGTATADNRRVLSETALRISNFCLSVGAAATTASAVTAAAAGGADVVEQVIPEVVAPSTSTVVSMYSGAPSSMAIQYKGCYNDNGKTPDVNGAFTIMKDLTPAKCAAYCADGGFTIMAVQSGEQCSCGNTYGAQGVDSSNSGCKTACSGSMDLTCGGNKKNAIYSITGSPDGYTYMGCYKDDATGPAFETAPKTFKTANSPEVCAEECTDYNYFGLQAGNLCFCANSGVMRYGPAAGCNVPCTGDNSKACGGALVNTVYAQRNSGAMTFKGCFQDKATKPDLSGAAKSLQSFSTPQTCYSYCKGLHFLFFGLQEGDRCYCGYSYGLYGASDLSACDVFCSGDSSIPCGGETTNSVYQINY